MNSKGWVGLAMLLVLGMGARAKAQQTVVTSGGTASQVPKFSDGTTLVNSAITESNGNVGIGTTSPAYALDLSSSNIPFRINGSSSSTEIGVVFSSAVSNFAELGSAGASGQIVNSSITGDF